MSTDLAVFIFGALLLSIGILGGGFTVREIAVPKVGIVARGLAAVAGIVFVIVGISLGRPQVPQSPQAPVAAPPTVEPAQRALPTDTPVRVAAPTPVPTAAPTRAPIPPTPIPPRPTAVIPASARVGAPYPADVVQNFMNSCVATGGTQSVCACAIREIQNSFSLDEFSRIEVRVSLGDALPDDMLDILAECRVLGR